MLWLLLYTAPRRVPCLPFGPHPPPVADFSTSKVVWLPVACALVFAWLAELTCKVRARADPFKRASWWRDTWPLCYLLHASIRYGMGGSRGGVLDERYPAILSEARREQHDLERLVLGSRWLCSTLRVFEASLPVRAHGKRVQVAFRVAPCPSLYLSSCVLLSLFLRSPPCFCYDGS